MNGFVLTILDLAGCGAINTESAVSADFFEEIWTAAARGETLVVTTDQGRSVAFDLEDAGEALGEFACLAVGHSN